METARGTITPKTKTGSTIIDRVIWSHKSEVGPVIVIFAAIHGNELAGIYACKRLASQLNKMANSINGSIYMISGNRKAIGKGHRFIDIDLNRIWNEFGKPGSRFTSEHEEWEEADDILKCINKIIDTHHAATQAIHFIDLHTTSAESCSFILFNDTLKNRQIATWFPVPQILGIEESIHGTLLSYINDLGFPAIGFEAGGHTDPGSADRMESFLWQYLYHTGVLNLDYRDLHVYEEQLRTDPEVSSQYYEITYHHYVEDGSHFRMKKGFRNFDFIEKGELLAYENHEAVYAFYDGRIFMPLYQNKGNDGFFILRNRSPLWLELSSIFRDSFVNNYLHILPGVDQFEEGHFMVNLRKAKFLVKQIFHLLGYRVIRKDKYTLQCYKR